MLFSFSWIVINACSINIYARTITYTVYIYYVILHILLLTYEAPLQ